MEYEAKNYELLEQIYKEISRFFSFADTRSILNIGDIKRACGPYSGIEIDEVANAICWCSDALQMLRKRLSVRCLDEVLSFAESVLESRLISNN